MAPIPLKFEMSLAQLLRRIFNDKAGPDVFNGIQSTTEMQKAHEPKFVGFLFHSW